MRTRLFALSLALLAGPTFAADRILTLAPDHAKVTFLLGATGHDVEGSFPLHACSVRFDPSTGAASGEISLDAAASTSGNPKRDKAMHEKVLLADANPLIVFHPQHFDGKLPETGASDVRLDGTVTIAGADHQLSMPAHVERKGDGLHLATTFPVPFVEWGIHDPSVMFLKVDKVVNLTIEGDASLGVAEVPVDPAHGG